VHGRGRNPESMDDLFFGVHDEMLYARKTEPVEGILILLYCILFSYIRVCMQQRSLWQSWYASFEYYFWDFTSRFRRLQLSGDPDFVLLKVYEKC
jgi:hypothetical protein